MIFESPSKIAYSKRFLELLRVEIGQITMIPVIAPRPPRGDKNYIEQEQCMHLAMYDIEVYFSHAKGAVPYHRQYVKHKL